MNTPNPQPRFDWSAPVERERNSLPVAQSEHTIATHHSAMGAEAAAKTRVSKSIQLRALLEKAGDRGLSDWEIHKETGWLMSTVNGVRNHMSHAIWPADREDESPSGNPITCWRLATREEMETKKRATQSELPASEPIQERTTDR